MAMRRRFVPSRIVVDPHHEGTALWCYEGGYLWHRTQGQLAWTRVRRVSFTPRRILVIAALFNGTEDDYAGEILSPHDEELAGFDLGAHSDEEVEYE